jgi:hypothetical protein
MVTKHRPSFDPKSFIARVGDGRSICKYRKGQVVFSQGDPGDAVFYIQKGRAKLTVVSEHGKEMVIAILGVEEFFGEGMSCRAGAAHSDVHDHDGLHHRSIGKINYYPGNSSGTSILRKTHCASSGSEHPCRSRSYRSTIQFKARSALLACSCCWQTSARKGHPSL